ncbi:MAG: hypothetical protein ACTSYG_07350 [Candidatus Heimdallarchaeota archaeon]
MSYASQTQVQNAKAMLEAQNQKLREEMLAVAKMLDVSFEKMDAFRQLVVRFPEECHRLAPLVSCKKINPVAIDKLMAWGQHIGMMKDMQLKPRATIVYKYRILVSRVLTVAAKHSPEVLIGMIFGEKTEKIMKSYDKEDSDEKESILNLG